MIVVIGHRDLTARDEIDRAAKAIPVRVAALVDSLPALREAVRKVRPDGVIVDGQIDPGLAGFIRELTALPGHPRVIVAVRGPILLPLWRTFRSAGAIGLLPTRDGNAMREALARLLVLDNPSCGGHNRHEYDVHKVSNHRQHDRPAQ